MSFSCYYIRQLGCTMKPKKRSTITNKKCFKKPNINKPLQLVDKTIVTTKEKTHNTIEDPVQIKDHRTLVHTPRNTTTRLSCRQKLEELSLSPFSSPGGSSFSPKCRRAISPVVLKQEKQKKPFKEKNLVRGEKVSKISQQKRYSKDKTKTAKEQCNLTYQKFVLKRLDEKKITQLSQESQASVNKLNQLYVAAKTINNKVYKNQIILRQLRQKIMEKYSRELPSLKNFELKFYCSIVLIQRLWKQRRIKNFISDFISPRSIHRENNFSKLETTGASQEQTSELIRKYHNVSSIFQKKCEVIEREVYSTEIETAKKKRIFELKDLQLSSELGSQKQKKIIKFVQCIRDIKFTKPITNQTKKYSRTNVFNLQESLSQKCLMHSFYDKIFKNSPTKMNNFQVFNSKKEQKKLQRSIQLINNINSPQKAELIQIQQRFQTELQSQQPKIENFEIRQVVQKVEAGVGTSPIEQPLKNKQIKSLNQLNNLSEQIIFLVLNEFCEQFHAFTSRSILRKKKKNSLPGLKVTLGTIEQYLTGLTSYMMQNYEPEVVRRFNVISPLSFLRIHHQYDDQQEEEYLEQDDQMNMPIIPNSLFYQYQLVYQSQKFQIREEDKKFSNFLQSLIKIHNLLLSNCLSELLQKTRIQRVVLPWDKKFESNRHKKNKLQKKSFETQLSKIIKSICSSAFSRVGQFHKRLDEPAEQQKLLKSISLEYKQEANEWSAQYEYLELRMDLTKYVEEVMLQEVMQDIMIFF